LGGNHFVAGSNWVDAYANFRETVALRSDGTLWVSEKPRHRWTDEYQNGTPPPEDSPPLVQFGDETNWLSVACGFITPVVLLKRDGTLWNWGSNSYNVKSEPGLRSSPPLRLGTESDWARILRGINGLYAWKRDGRAWIFLRELDTHRGETIVFGNVEIASGAVAVPVPFLDHANFQRLKSFPNLPDLEIGIRADGTLWYWDSIALDPYLQQSAALRQAKGMTWTGPAGGIVQIGKDSNWAAVGGGRFEVVALKTDGSVWRWNLYRAFRFEGSRAMAEGLKEAPVRLGTHNDWVALGCCMDETVALAADGTLWCWPQSDGPDSWYNEDWLAPSKRPAKIENIFGASE
jgi:alpha-tubulin suppressor-like RCC1 family protein